MYRSSLLGPFTEEPCTLARFHHNISEELIPGEKRGIAASHLLSCGCLQNKRSQIHLENEVKKILLTPQNIHQVMQ